MGRRGDGLVFVRKKDTPTTENLIRARFEVCALNTCTKSNENLLQCFARADFGIRFFFELFSDEIQQHCRRHGSGEVYVIIDLERS